jgi:hypothetical protein
MRGNISVHFPRCSSVVGKRIDFNQSCYWDEPTDTPFSMLTLETAVACGKGVFSVIEGVHDNVTTVATVEQDGTASVGYPNMNPLFQLQERYLTWADFPFCWANTWRWRKNGLSVCANGSGVALGVVRRRGMCKPLQILNKQIFGSEFTSACIISLVLSFRMSSTDSDC